MHDDGVAALPDRRANTYAPTPVPRRIIRNRMLTVLSSVALGLGVLVGTAQPAAAADHALTYVPPRAYAWSTTQSYSGSCYLGNGVSWTFTARWNFGYTARPSVRVNSVQVTYRVSSGGVAGGPSIIDAQGAGVWQTYNNRVLPAATSYSQTFNVGGRVVTQGPNGIRFRVPVSVGNCGGATITANFYIRSS